MSNRYLNRASSAFDEVIASRFAVKTMHYSYHTDNHNINEDTCDISVYGGAWGDRLNCGLFFRSMADAPSLAARHGASRLTTKTIHYSIHTDSHDISEDIVTISHLGGWWGMGSDCGLFRRGLFDAPFAGSVGVASRLVPKKNYTVIL